VAVLDLRHEIFLVSLGNCTFKGCRLTNNLNVSLIVHNFKWSIKLKFIFVCFVLIVVSNN